MRTAALLATLLLAAMVAGCAGPGLYSEVEYGPRQVSASTLDQLVQANGMPDVQGQVGPLYLVGWKGGEGMSLWDKILTGLPLFADAKKSSLVALVDSQRQVVTAARGRRGKLTTVLGVLSTPVMATDQRP